MFLYLYLSLQCIYLLYHTFVWQVYIHSFSFLCAVALCQHTKHICSMFYFFSGCFAFVSQSLKCLYCIQMLTYDCIVSPTPICSFRFVFLVAPLKTLVLYNGYTQKNKTVFLVSWVDSLLCGVLYKRTPPPLPPIFFYGV